MLFCVIHSLVQCVCVYLHSITYLLAAGQDVALSADSTEWLFVLYIHTTGAPGPHTIERASLMDGNTETEDCIAGDSPPLRYLGDEQEKQTETESFNNQC